MKTKTDRNTNNDQLRMDMKYLMFDLEATRRERDSHKNALEDETPFAIAIDCRMKVAAQKAIK